MPEASIALREVSFAYHSRQILDGLTFAVQPGSFTALLGPNGAGKSTVFNLLTGLLVPQQGQIYLAGYNTQKEPQQAAKQTGIVFQQTTLDLELSVMQNLQYYCGLYNLRNYTDYLMALCTDLGLLASLKIPVRQLNGGHRRRVEIVRALLGEPQILLLDEPTVGLDNASKNIIVEFIHELVFKGVSVLWITHLLDELRDSDQVLLINQGAISGQGSFAQLGRAEGITSMYGQTNARPKL